MKSLCTLTLAASLAASTAFSGNLSDPVIETPPQIIIEETAASSIEPGNLILPLIIVAFFAAGILSDPSGGGIGTVISDARVKTDVTPVGVADNGLTIYQYSYTGSSTVFEGVMAQEVLMHTPAAVETNPATGIMRVNYDLLGITPRLID